jgi:uncharacterized protein (TIGR02145 family)
MKKTLIKWPFMFLIILITLYSFTVKNISDNEYNIIKIGEQEWMTENLNVRYFRNGDPIFEANSYEEWELANIKGIPAWCYYNNNPQYGKTYGKLYNWWAVSDPRGLAPEGWHIPGEEEWQKLADNLGGMDLAGEQLKSDEGWKNDGNGNNKSAFSGLPGGYRSHEGPGYQSGPFFDAGSGGYWWSTGRYLVDNAWCRSLSYKNKELEKKSFVKTAGLSVRVIKD